MGILIASFILLLWVVHLVYILLNVSVSFDNPWMYMHIFIQTYFYTGLFITGHDAMHQLVSRIKFINNAFGHLSAFMFAGMSYKKLIKNHWDHHKYPGTDRDPDFTIRSQNLWVWWFMFMRRYTTIWQVLIMALIFNFLYRIIGLEVSSLLVLWIVPAFISTFQLFYFGTFLPHRKPHTNNMGKHRARTLKKNHFWAMLSCYFFGYHYEHHASPATPWWLLSRIKM
ncbi:MAG: fatty acid desaturase [Bacteroidales bacterium]|jgi:beta-carotene ketolase (CrtW type)|nr:fatty acid desaturase [Bacteroidales bacterium]